VKDGLPFVKTHPHDTASNQTPVLSRVSKEEEIAAVTMSVIVITSVEDAWFRSQPDPTVRVGVHTRGDGHAEVRWCHVSTKMLTTVEVLINPFRVA